MTLDEREMFEDLYRHKVAALLRLKRETIARIGRYPISDKELRAVAMIATRRELGL